MSTKVKERLKKLALEMTHEERITLDEALDKIAMKMGMIVVGKPCDALIEQIPDDKLREIVAKIKKKKKKLLELSA
jgi:hypothetical protein